MRHLFTLDNRNSIREPEIRIFVDIQVYFSPTGALPPHHYL
jgi:hypothetical protein